MATITCVCDKTFDAVIPESVDLSDDTGTLRQILKGTYLTFTCPHCGHLVKPEEPLRVTDANRDIDIFLVPERDRNRYLLGLTDYPDADRVVIGYPELVEKLKIYDAGLDDSAVELIKYYLLVRVGAGTTPTILFEDIERESLVLEIIGLRDDEVGRVNIPRGTYEQAASELPEKRLEEPYNTFLEPPYVSINKIEIEES